MKTNKKEFTVYETPSIDELELINEGAIFSNSWVEGGGSIDPDEEQ